MEDLKKKTEERAAEDRLFNFRPLFFSALAFLLGLIFAFLQKGYGVSVWWGFCLLLPAATPFFFRPSKDKTFRILLAETVLTVCFLGGNLVFFSGVSNFNDCGRYNGEFTVHGRVMEKMLGEEYLCVTLDDVFIGGKEENGKLVAYLPAAFGEDLRLLDGVAITGEVRTDTSLFSENGLRAWEITEDIRYTVWADECVVTGHTFDLFLAVRARMETVAYAGMDKESAAVAMALFAGDDSGIEDGLLENIRFGGVAHVFAVSGLHIGAVFGFCALLFTKTKLSKLPKIARFLIVAALVFFYGGVCGFSASVVRATVTCLLFYAASLLGVGSDSTENLGAAMLVAAVISPLSVFTVGFQLSFAACLGIAWLARPIQGGLDVVCDFVKDAFAKRKEKTEADEDTHPLGLLSRIRRACVSFLGVSIAAQAATAPILLSSFGYLSVAALFLNCIFVPILGVVFSALLLITFLACLLPAAWSVVLLYVPSTLFSAAMLLFQAVDFSKFCLTGVLSGGSFVCYYAALVFLSDKCNMKKGTRLALFFLFLLVFGITVYALNA